MNFYVHSLFVDGSYELKQKLFATNTFPVSTFLRSANITIAADSYARIALWKHQVI